MVSFALKYHCTRTSLAISFPLSFFVVLFSRHAFDMFLRFTYVSFMYHACTVFGLHQAPNISHVIHNLKKQFSWKSLQESIMKAL